MVNYDSDDSRELWPEDHEDYAEWKMACQYRKRDVEEKYFAESSLLEIPTFMAGALMARRLKSPADLCCLAIAVIKAKAGQCTDKQIAAQHCRAYAYIPQWLFFEALLDKLKSCEEVKKDVDGLITLQYIDDWLVRESPLGTALLRWSQTLHNECLCPRNLAPRMNVVTICTHQLLSYYTFLLLSRGATLFLGFAAVTFGVASLLLTV